MAAIDTLDAANAVVSVLEGLSGMGSVQIGAPAAIGAQVSAFVTMGSVDETRKATGVTQQQKRLFVMLVYRVKSGTESTAETALMDLVDAFYAAVNADKTLGGVVDAADVSSLAADEPDYQMRAGMEYREYPLIVTYTQQGSYETTP